MSCLGRGLHLCASCSTQFIKIFYITSEYTSKFSVSDCTIFPLCWGAVIASTQTHTHPLVFASPVSHSARALSTTHADTYTLCADDRQEAGESAGCETDLVAYNSCPPRPGSTTAMPSGHLSCLACSHIYSRIHWIFPWFCPESNC